MKYFYLIVSFLVSDLFISTYSVASDQKMKTPNIVIIMSDDQGGWDYGFMGNKLLDTPNIDAMATRSARLSRFYVSPVCTPTRANLMTGRYNYRTRAIDTYVGRASMDTAEVTIAEMLEKAGYQTGIFGKWHLGDSYPMRPQDQGFHEVLVHRGGGIGQPSDPIGGEGKYTDPILFHNGVEKQMKGYVTDIIFDNAMDFIEKNNSQGKPTFTYIAPNAPHGPFHDVPQELLKKYKSKDLTSSFASGKVSEKMLDTEARIFAMIENIDENVGKFFTHLKKIGAYENTLVFYLNDNGPNSMRYVGPHREKKGEIEEGGIRSILLAHWPERLKAGTVNDRIAAHYDLFPTILSAVGVEQPDHKIDGKNIMPLLEGKAGDWPDRKIYLQWHRGDEPSRYINGAVVGQKYKMLYPKQGGAAQLYNLDDDPAESNNLVTTEPSILAEYEADYERWFKDVGSTRPDNYGVALIHIGNDKELKTVLTRQDWRVKKGSMDGWGPKTFGNWPVVFDRSGKYNIEITFKKNQADGEASLEFSVGSVRSTVQLDKSATSHLFENVEIETGKQTIDALLTEGGKSHGVWQVFVTKQK